MAGQRLLPNPARLTQQKQPPNHSKSAPPHTPKLPLQLPFFVALRGQKEVAVAVAVLRAPPRPPRTMKLQLSFFAVLRGPSWTKGVAVAVLRGPSRPFVDQKEVAVAVLRGPPWTKGVAVAVLRGPSWIKKKLPLPFPATLRGQNKINASIPNASKRPAQDFP